MIIACQERNSEQTTTLRHALNKAVPYVRNNPDKLICLWITVRWLPRGPAPCHGRPLYPERGDRGFQWRPESADAPVLLWLRDNQPDAINNPALGKSYSPLMWIFCATMSVISA